MLNPWTEKEINKIILGLNDLGLPFEGYAFSLSEGEPICLGSGASGYVFAAKKGKKERYAIKVIGLKSGLKSFQSIKKTIEYQESAAGVEKFTVRVYDHTCISVKLNDELEIVEAGNEICLYFMLIERLKPVIEHVPGGGACLVSKRLGRKREIYKLAFEIGKALENAHKNGVMHRDVKLENIFYSERERKYKLGDFDVSGEIDSIYEKRVAFTNGYGAPEVVGYGNGEYDGAADIYSFGITLYLLINDLCFPGSNGYRVNISEQYNEDAELKEPKIKYFEFFKVIKKMCSFKPEDRYRSMSDVVNEIEGVRYGQNIKARRKERKGSFVMGMFLAMIAGMIIPSAYDLQMTMEWSLYIVIGLSLVKTVLDIFDKKKAARIMMIPLFIAAFGNIIICGFSLPRFLCLILMVFVTSYGGIIASAYLGIVMSMLTGVYSVGTQGAGKYEWLPIMFLSVAVTFATQYLCLSFRNEIVNRLYHSGNILFKSGVVLFSLLIIAGIMLSIYTSPLSNLITGLAGAEAALALRNCRLWLAGLVGGFIYLLFSLRFFVMSGS